MVRLLRTGGLLAATGALVMSTAVVAQADSHSFNVTIADQSANSVLAALPSSVNLEVSVSGLPETRLKIGYLVIQNAFSASGHVPVILTLIEGGAGKPARPCIGCNQFAPDWLAKSERQRL